MQIGGVEIALPANIGRRYTSDGKAFAGSWLEQNVRRFAHAEVAEGCKQADNLH